MESVSFTRLDQGTAEEFELLGRALQPQVEKVRAGLADAVLQMVREQAGSFLGYRVDRMTHSLQTATRAQRDGADEETVVAALLHDIGDGLGLHNHSEFAAALLRPFLGEQNAWVVEHHGLFQGYYFMHHFGQDRNARDRYRGHPHFEACVEFCERWDQRSFDPGYDTLPLAAFEPAVRRLFMKAPVVY